MLELGDEKMSKSLGNVVTLRNVLDSWGRDMLLLYHMSGHWRKPVDFTDESLESSRTQLAGFREALALPERAAADWGKLEAALEDDFNTPAALALLHVWASRGARDELARGLDLFGLQTEFEVPAEVEELRRRARRRAPRRTGLWPTRRATSSTRRVGGDRPSGRHAVWLRP